jgi:DNA processing protein
MNALLPEPAVPAADAPASRSPESLTEPEKAVWTALAGGETQLDAIISQTGLTAAAASSLLMRMELKRLVKQLPGRHFVRLE